MQLEIQQPQPAYTDDRGVITDVLVKVPMEHVTLITSCRGSVRGNHYHQDTTQWVYVIEGRLQLLAQKPGQPVQVVEVERGALVTHGPMESHTMVALEDSVFMVFTRGPRGGADYESDTFRLAEPLEVIAGKERGP